MAWTLHDTVKEHGSNSISAPAASAGDLVFIVSRSGTSSASIPTGFTQLFDVLNGTSHLQFWWKISDGSEPASYTATGTTTRFMQAASWTPPAGTVSVDAHAEQLNSPASTTLTAPSITISNAGALLLFIGLVTNNAPGWATPTGFTEDVNGCDNDVDRRLSWAYQTGVAAGATGDVTTTLSSSQTSQGALVAFTAGTPSVSKPNQVIWMGI